MAWLVIDTFLLVLIAIAIGILLGRVLRHTLGAGAEPMPAVAGASVAHVEGVPSARTASALDGELTMAYAPAPQETPGEAEDRTSETVPAEEPAAGTADGIIDADRAASADQVGVRPDALAGPRDHAPDDLKRIKGIGPQNEARLNALGIFHFDQIAAWSPEEARWVGTYLAFPGRIEREDWIGQARRLTVDQ